MGELYSGTTELEKVVSFTKSYNLSEREAESDKFLSAIGVLSENFYLLFVAKKMSNWLSHLTV